MFCGEVVKFEFEITFTKKDWRKLDAYEEIVHVGLSPVKIGIDLVQSLSEEGLYEEYLV